MSEFAVIASHPVLRGWGFPAARRVPFDVRKELQRLGSVEAAQDYLAQTGLHVLRDQKRDDHSVFSGNVTVDGGLPPYNSMQIIISRQSGSKIPPGTVLVNGLIRRDGSLADNLRCFANYQACMTGISTLLQAAPFACLTDYPLTEDHSAAGGFRFFFSSYPHSLLRTMKSMLALWQEFNACDLKTTPGEKLIALTGEIQANKFQLVGGANVDHQILEDIKLPARPTYLAFIR